MTIFEKNIEENILVCPLCNTSVYEPPSDDRCPSGYHAPWEEPGVLFLGNSEPVGQPDLDMAEIVARAEDEQIDWPAFDRWIQRHHPERWMEILDESQADWRFVLPLKRNMVALVLGCGWGNLVMSLASTCESVYAVESNPLLGRFVAARVRKIGIHNVIPSVFSLGFFPFVPGSFDLVVVEDPAWLGVAQSRRWVKGLASPDAALAKLGNLLKPSGILVCGSSAQTVVQVMGKRLALLRRTPNKRSRRLIDRLRNLGFGEVTCYLAFPNRKTSSYLIDAKNAVTLRKGFSFLARHFLDARNARRGLFRRLLINTPLAASALNLIADHWVVASERGNPVIKHSDWAPTESQHLGGILGSDGSVLFLKGNSERNSRAHIICLDADSASPLLTHVARDPAEKHLMAREHANLSRLEAELSPEMRSTIPKSLRLFEFQGHAAITLGWLEGERLTTVLREMSQSNREVMLSEVLRDVLQWLVRLQMETGTFQHFDEVIIKRHLSVPIDAFVDACSPRPPFEFQAQALFSIGKGMLGQSVLLSVEHGDFWHRNILWRQRVSGNLRVTVVDWELAAFDQLPFADLYSLVISIGLLILKDDADMLHPEEALRFTFSGETWYSELVGATLRRYAKRIGMDQRWGSILLPLSLLRMATLHKSYFQDRFARQWQEMAEFCLCCPEELPVASGFRS